MSAEGQAAPFYRGGLSHVLPGNPQIPAQQQPRKAIRIFTQKTARYQEKFPLSEALRFPLLLCYMVVFLDSQSRLERGFYDKGYDLRLSHEACAELYHPADLWKPVSAVLLYGGYDHRRPPAGYRPTGCGGFHRIH